MITWAFPTRIRTNFERIIIALVLSIILFLVGYNLGLREVLESTTPHDSTPLQAEIGSPGGRWALTYHDTTEGGSVIEVYTDYIWHESILTITYRGEEIARAEILR